MRLSPQAYRTFARECLKWAEQSSDLTVREAFYCLARDWLRAAETMPEQTSPWASQQPLA